MLGFKRLTKTNKSKKDRSEAFSLLDDQQRTKAQATEPDALLRQTDGAAGIFVSPLSPAFDQAKSKAKVKTKSKQKKSMKPKFKSSFTTI